MEKYRVMIVEDQAMPRQLFEMLIRSSDRYEVAVSIDNADVADIYCMKLPIDLILMDVLTKGNASGLTAAEKIRRQYPDIRIIIVTSMPEYSFIDRARKAGVDSFWYKEVNEETILSLMDRTMQGESVYPDSHPLVPVGNTTNLAFTRRDYDILRELIRGDTNQEIAAKLAISSDTVKKGIGRMLDMTGFHSRTELAVRVREAGIVILNEGDGTASERTERNP